MSCGRRDAGPVRRSFQRRLTHGPGAVRLLIYRPPDDGARVQKRARNHLKRALGAVLSEKFVISLWPPVSSRRELYSVT
jgi:hypothetical protein